MSDGTVTVAPPRVLPAVLLAAFYWIVVLTARTIAPGSFAHFMTTFWGPIVLAVSLLVWWLAFSRLPWRERLLEPLCLALGGLAILPIAHFSMTLMGVMMLAMPAALTVAACWMFAARRMQSTPRLIGLAIVGLIGWGAFTLVRVDGLGGDLKSEMSWRWSETAEQRFLAERQKTSNTAAPLVLPPVGPGDWPEFRGLERDSRVTGVRIATDWTAAPPKLLWKHRIGPGWSSFAVVGDYAFTQEQRGEEEAIACYRVSDGVEMWSHTDPGRFWEVVAGAGPRGTPTYRDGRLYALGANGLLNCLDATTGRSLWRRDVAKETEAKMPVWGFSASPLVLGENVIVYAGGPNDKGAAAYRASDGEPAWFGGKGSHGYSSPQRAVLDGVEQVLVAHDTGLDSLNPADGKLLWHHDWDMQGMARILQPHVLGDGRILLASGYGSGTRLLKPAHTGDAWTTDPVWTSKKLNPYYNDFVVYKNHAYGFDGNIFCCVDLETGERPWKKGRYGYGQVLLLEDQALLLVLSDEGDAVLVEADPAALKEVARFKALEGKTWNHPVVAHGKLLVRNAEEAACYELKLP